MSNWEKVIAEAQLISLPEAFLQLKSVLDQDDFSMAEVAMPISQDPALTARLLRLVNSSFYGFSGKIDTVFRAVTMIGTRQVYELALATAVTQTFDGMGNRIIDMPGFWCNSVYCGLAAKNLAKACNLLNSERLFVAGLLHDIGHLIMYQSIPELCEQAIILSNESLQPLYLVERDIIGLDYARVGGALARQWQLPGSLRETTEFHVTPEQSRSFPLETYLVNIAVQLTAIQNGNIEDARFHPDALQQTGISLEDCESIMQQTELEISKVMSSIFP